MRTGGPNSCAAKPTSKSSTVSTTMSVGRCRVGLGHCRVSAGGGGAAASRYSGLGLGWACTSFGGWLGFKSSVIAGSSLGLSTSSRSVRAGSRGSSGQVSCAPRLRGISRRGGPGGAAMGGVSGRSCSGLSGFWLSCTSSLESTSRGVARCCATPGWTRGC